MEPTSAVSDPLTIADVYRARKHIAPYLSRTPLYRYSTLESRIGTKACVFVKHENHQPIGAFKVRGGIHLVGSMSLEERERGVISASTGNHGQSIAYAARLFGVEATIAVPEDSNPGKVASIEGLGAKILVHGREFDDARREVERRSADGGPRYVHSANEPLLVAGVATYALEILEDEPDLDAIFVPVGGGSGAAGVGLVMKTLAPRARVIAVGAEAAPAARDSWREGRLVEHPQSTIADGLATSSAFEYTQAMMRQYVDEFVLVSDTEMCDASRLYLETTRNLIEPSGAASLAAARRFLREDDSGGCSKIAVIASGGNISIDVLRSILD